MRPNVEAYYAALPKHMLEGEAEALLGAFVESNMQTLYYHPEIGTILFTTDPKKYQSIPIVDALALLQREIASRGGGTT